MYTVRSLFRLMWLPPQSRYRIFPSCGSLRRYPFVVPSPWKPLSFFYLYNFVISTILSQWNHTVSIWKGMEFFTKHNFLKFVCESVSFFCCWVIFPRYRCTSLFHLHLLKDISIISSFLLLWINVLWTFINSFLFWH